MAVPNAFINIIKVIDTVYKQKILFTLPKFIYRAFPNFPVILTNGFPTAQVILIRHFIANIQGSVWLTFIVEKDGSVSNLKIRHGLYKELNQEGLKVAQKMPKWKPGTVNNHKAQAEMVLHLHFEIRGTPLKNVYTITQSVWGSVATKQ